MTIFLKGCHFFFDFDMMSMSRDGDFSENALDVGDGDAIVGHGHTLGTTLLHSREHELAVKHASAAMDDQVIPR